MLEFNIRNPADRACSVTPVLVHDRERVAQLLNWCDKRCGVVLGHGIGEFTGRAFRIAHMGYVNAPMVLGTLEVVETGLRANAIPHGSGGVQAAIDYLADAVGM